MLMQLGNNKSKVYDIIVIDGMNVVYRHYFKLKFASTKAGLKSGMIYGFYRFISLLKIKYPISKIVVAWDSKRSLLKRREVDKEYKANRKKLELEGFKEQLKDLVWLNSLIGVEQYYSEGYEADDIAYTICQNGLSGHGRHQRILLVSTDRDWAQMLGSNVDILFDNEVKTREQVFNDLGIDFAWQLTLSKVIYGDGSDNIPSVAKHLSRKVGNEFLNSFKAIKDLREDFIVIIKRWLFRGTKAQKKFAQIMLENKERFYKNIELVLLKECKLVFTKTENNQKAKRLILNKYEMAERI